MICKASFFGLKDLPILNISDETLQILAKESVDKGLTVPGVQKKLSIHLAKGEISRLTLIGYPAGYILKPQSDEYSCLPELEDLTMDMAAATEISVVPHGLIKMQNNQFAFITKRIDRDGNKKIAMEDFCQLTERLTEDKYKASYEQCAKVIKQFSSRPGLDLAEFFLRIVFCFVTGNSDMHLKNFSLIESANEQRNYTLSQAYDLLPVNLIVQDDKEETALTMLGKKKHFSRKDFEEFAESISLNKKAADNMINKVLSKRALYIEMTQSSLLPNDMKSSYIALIQERIDRLSPDHN